MVLAYEVPRNARDRYRGIVTASRSRQEWSSAQRSAKRSIGIRFATAGTCCAWIAARHHQPRAGGDETQPAPGPPWTVPSHWRTRPATWMFHQEVVHGFRDIAEAFVVPGSRCDRWFGTGDRDARDHPDVASPAVSRERGRSGSGGGGRPRQVLRTTSVVHRAARRDRGGAGARWSGPGHVGSQGDQRLPRHDHVHRRRG
jgi:hypothetical protein